MSQELLHGISPKHAAGSIIQNYASLAQLPAVGSSRVRYIVGTNVTTEYKWDSTTSSYVIQKIPINDVNNLDTSLAENKTMAKRDVVISTSAPNNSVGVDGDFWFVIS